MVLIVIYANCDGVERSALWDHLVSLKSSSNGLPSSPNTWCNNMWGNSRIFARLDRCLLNSNWSEYQVKLQHLPCPKSDHNLLLTDMSRLVGSGPKPFKFLDAWLDDDSCLQVIKNSWALPVEDNGNMSFRWFLKLKRLKSDLRQWNKDSFGNIFDNVKNSELELPRVLKDHDLFLSEDGFFVFVMVAQQNLEMAIHREEKFSSKKARCRWLKDGDKNTLFFHSVVKNRHNTSFIHAIRDG